MRCGKKLAGALCVRKILLGGIANVESVVRAVAQKHRDKKRYAWYIYGAWKFLDTGNWKRGDSIGCSITV